MGQPAETFKEELNQELLTAGTHWEMQERIMLLEAQGEIF